MVEHCLGLAVDEVVEVLHRGDRHDPAGGLQLFDRDLRQPDRPDLALLEQVAEQARLLVRQHLGIDPVQLEQVDPLRGEAPEPFGGVVHRVVPGQLPALGLVRPDIPIARRYHRGAHMLDDRKAAILRAVVEEYIQTAQPVGSSHVARQTGLAVSPATVRNEMSQLEHEGYLYQPHTSAGRVPTDKGYRFLVDSLTTPGVLDDGRAQQVRAFFARAHGALERMLADTSRLLTGLTDYAAVVTAPNAESLTLRSVQLVSLSPRVVLVLAVLSNGTIEKRTLDLAPDAEPGDATVGAASSHLAVSLTGAVWGSTPLLIATGDAAVDDLANRALVTLAATAPTGNDQVYVGGAARMAAAFDAVDTIRQVLSIMEQQYVLVTLLRDVLDSGLSVAIGTEHGMQSLADCSLVVAPYEVEGDRGTIAILGPTRMHYDQALAAVGVVSERLGRALSEGA